MPTQEEMIKRTKLAGQEPIGPLGAARRNFNLYNNAYGNPYANTYFPNVMGGMYGGLGIDPMQGLISNIFSIKNNRENDGMYQGQQVGANMFNQDMMNQLGVTQKQLNGFDDQQLFDLLQKSKNLQ